MSRKSSHIAVLLGSARDPSNTRKATAVVCDELDKAGCQVTLLDPRQLTLGLPGHGQDPKVMTRMQDMVRDADGVVMVTPEYDGSFSAAIKLMIEHLGYPSVLQNKPISLLGVASGGIGAVKALEHLRSVCGSIGGIPLPYSKSINLVDRVFDENGVVLDQKAGKAMASAATDLLEFLNP